MVHEDSASGRQMSLLLQYLAPPPEKNTFIHYVERKEGCDLFRAHTEPHSGSCAVRGLEQLEADSDDGNDVGCAGKAWGSRAFATDNEDDADLGQDDFDQPPQEWTEAQWQPQGPTEEQWPPQCEAPPQCELPPQREAPPRRSPHDVWILEGRKLRGKDTRQSHVFTVTLPEAVATLAGCDSDCDNKVEFVVMLRPKIKNKRRGGGSFAASEGKGYVEVKCTVQINVQMALSVEVGHGGQPLEGFPPIYVVHNFAEDAVCQLPAEWNFWEEIDADTGNLSLGFRAEPRGIQCAQLGEADAYAEEQLLLPPWLNTPGLYGEFLSPAVWDGVAPMWAACWVPCGWLAPVIFSDALPVVAADGCGQAAPAPAAEPVAGQAAAAAVALVGVADPAGLQWQ